MALSIQTTSEISDSPLLAIFEKPGIHAVRSSSGIFWQQRSKLFEDPSPG